MLTGGIIAMRGGKSIRYEAEVAWRIQMGLSFTVSTGSW